MHSITKQGSKLVALVRGRLNREEAETLVRDVEGMMKESGAALTRVIVDMNYVEYLSSSGISALVKIFKTASDDKINMVICCGKPELKSLMEIAGLDRLVKVVDKVGQE